ncbi:MAG TPA: protein kinase [Gallionella sp.]|nr:protein kinase [Gallionella sp.]
MISHLGRYEIAEELGRGAMGIVYKAYDPLIERFVAIKTINLQVLSKTERAEYETRFYQEAKAAGHLSHPNIVTIYDLGESGDIAYIAMELMEGRELQEMLYGKGRLLVTDALNIAIQVAAGLSYAHQRGVVHGDIKPSNIMVLGDNLVKIADFGIAKMASSGEKKPEDGIYGTPPFMSPEQIQGKSIDARSDIFSLGVVLYYMLTDRLPFPEEDINLLMNQIVGVVPEKPSSLNPGIPEALDTVISRCLAKDPDARYKNANDLAIDLRACLSALLHTRTGPDQPLTSNVRFKRLRSVVTPRGFSRTLVAHGSYFAIFSIVAIFMIDMVTPSTIQMEFLYIFPLVVISLHCERMKLIGGAVVLALLLQGIHIAMDTMPMSSKIINAIMVLLINITVVFISRIARTNFIEVEQLSSFDRLTGLRNRLSFELITDIEIDRQKQRKAVFSFAYIDLNNLKELNETRGYAAGDKAIKLAARVIRENIRQFDTPARIGGDEFAILMPNINAVECESFCKQLTAEIAKQLGDAPLSLSASIGYASFEKPPVSISEVFDKSENAMHRAKTSGKPFSVSA